MSLEACIAIAKKARIPLLVDAAAELPPAQNLSEYTKMGADLVAFSGGKGLRGPQNAGLLVGRKDLVEAAPKTVKENLTKDEAEKLKKELEGQGATIELK